MYTRSGTHKLAVPDITTHNANQEMLTKECFHVYVKAFLFTFQRPDDGPSESISSIAVALGCALAATILGTAAIVFVTRRILKSRSTVNYEILREPLRHESKKYQCSS